MTTRHLRIPLLAIAASVAALAGTSAAGAAPALEGEFPVSGKPGEMALASDGTVWFTLTDSPDGKELGRIAPDGAVTEFDTPNDKPVVGMGAGPDVAGGPHNRLWMTQSGGVVKWDPVAKKGTAFPVATLAGPRSIAPDAQGNLWAVEADGLIKIAPSGEKIDDVPVTGASGRGIALGSDGRMWWADFFGSIRATSVASPYATVAFPTGGSPRMIAAGPAGQLAFGDPGTDPQSVARVSIGGALSPTAAPLADPDGVAFGADGAWWFAEFLAEKLGRLTPQGAHTQPIAFPAGSGPRHVEAAGATLWVALEASRKIARVTGVTPPAAPPAGGAGTPKPPAGEAGTPKPPAGGGRSGADIPPRRDATRPRVRMVRIDLRGRRVALRLSEHVRLRLRLERRRTGRRSGGRCLLSARRGPRCARWVPVRTVRATLPAGTRRVSLGRKLPHGRLRIVVTAADRAGNRSAPARRSFSIPRPEVKR